MTETVWLVERQHDNRTEWLCQTGWTTIATAAIRFCRKADGEQVVYILDTHDILEHKDVSVVEHIFYDTPTDKSKGDEFEI